MDRRTFLKTGAASGALVTIGTGAPGCGNDVDAAPLAAVTTLQTPIPPATITQAVLFDNALAGASYGTVQLQFEAYLDLKPVGGAITLQLGSDIVSSNNRGYTVPIDNTILLIHQSDGSDGTPVLLAVQSSCPHAGCPLGYSQKNSQIECPCHSSRFAAVSTDGQCVGQVLHAPARADLQTWQVTVTTDPTAQHIVSVDLKSSVSCLCATLPPLVNRTLTLAFSDFPQLATVGGSVCGQPTGAPAPLVIVRVDASTISALNARCTHLGCTVAWTPANMDVECPCHGSVFSSTGAVLVGPATTPLESYPVTLNADSVVITIPTT